MLDTTLGCLKWAVVGLVSVRGDAFCSGVVARAEAGLIRSASRGEVQSAHVETAVNVQNVAGDI
jgi:hypothetical protein